MIAAHATEIHIEGALFVIIQHDYIRWSDHPEKVATLQTRVVLVLEEKYTDTEITCTLHPERPFVMGIEPRTFLL